MSEEADGDDDPLETVVEGKKITLRPNTSISTEAEAVEESRNRAEVILAVGSDEDRCEKFFTSLITLQVSMEVYSSLYLEEWKSWKKATVNVLCDVGFIDFIAEAYIYISKPDADFVNLVTRLDLRQVILAHICAYSDISLRAGKILAEKGIIPYLINDLNSEEVKLHLDEEQPSHVAVLALATAHNISKLSELKQKFEECLAVDAIKYYFSAPTEKMQMSALCAIACLLGESDASSELLDEYSIIPKIVDCLQAAMAREDHSSNGFSAEELVESLAFLAVNDQNKQKIVNLGAIDSLRKMLEPSASVLEKQRAVDCLWALAFNEEIRKQIYANEDILKLLDGLGNSADVEGLKVKAQRARDFIEFGKEGLTQLTEDSEKKTTESHIFISYCWKQQEIVLKIRQFLIDSGFKVWVDIDRMHGSTLEAMAAAVENASVVLLCYSDNYRLSNMCRTEAEYVFKLGKPFVPVNMQYHYQPSGWLGIIIGARLYIDCSLEKHPFEKVAPKLLSEIKMNISDAAGNNEKTDGDSGKDDVGEMNTKDKAALSDKEKRRLSMALPKKVARSPTTMDGDQSGPCECCKLMQSLVTDIFHSNNGNSPTRSKSIEKHNEVRSWSAENINNWLRVESMEHLVAHFQAFDGQALLGLHQMKFTASELYYKSLLQVVGDSFVDCVKVTAALDKLLEN